MARGRIRKSDKGSFSAVQMGNAIKAVNNGSSIRGAAKNFNLKFQTLARYVKKHKEAGDAPIRLTPNYSCRKIFTNEQENDLKQYIIKCSKMCYGQSTFNIRKLAYEMATINNIEVPDSWKKDKIAGLEWLHGFLKRAPDISIRRAENCSLSRMTAFNINNVRIFFENLRGILERCILMIILRMFFLISVFLYRNPEIYADGTRIYNLDETATTTVQKSSKIVAAKGSKQVCKASSSERGVLVTTCCTISASGNHMPPVMVFPRKKFNVKMTQGAPPGTLGLVSDSGWMTAEIFPDVIKHFIKYSNSSKENPSLLIYDNHESHLTIQAIKTAKENGVTILTLPPHSSHKMQPLDIAVFFPFKNYYNAELDNWMIRNPGRTISIYDIAACVAVAFDRAMKPETIKSGFKKSGIFPFDDQVFTEDDFLSSYVTDRPSASTERSEKPHVSKDNLPKNNVDKINVISDVLVKPGSSNQKSNFISPEVFKGFPKAEDRKKNNKKPKRGRSFIPTDTPEKEKLEELHNAKLLKKNKSEELKKVKREVFANKRVVEVSDSDTNDLSEGIDSDASSEYDVNEEINLFNEINFDETVDNLKVGDFILTRFKANKKEIYYVGQIKATNEHCCEVSFLRMSEKVKNKFIFPSVKDVAEVNKTDIAFKLPEPRVGGTKRQQGLLQFDVNFGDLNIR